MHRSLALTGGLLLLAGLPAVALAESSLDECADGVDNDSDGLIDLNDDGCGCGENTDLFERIESFIVNESFEDYASCPTSYSQLYQCDDWIQATNATSDYYACGLEATSNLAYYFGTFPTPPDGSAFTGAIMQSSSYVEYVGGCTTETLEVGREYTFEIYVAAPTGGNGYGGDTSGDIQLFGIPSCSSIPISTYATLEGSYDLLDEVNVTLVGGDAFQLITFTFTPSTTYEAVIFGPSADMTVPSGQSGNYVLFDSLTLNSTTSFGTEVTITGDCETGVTITSPEPADASFQWYRDGVAVSGATASTYVPLTDGSEDGLWEVRVDNGADCNTSTNQADLQCVIDEDGDGILDEDEDIDGDGDWTNDDTDGDGVPDYLDDDDDGDGVLTIDELDPDGDGEWSGSHGDDSDGDGIDDYLDDDDDDDGLSTEDEAAAGSDPLNPDSDGDGLTDGEEVNEYGTDPTSPDSDGCGISDADEVVLGTNPVDADSDGDGLSDLEESGPDSSTDPLNPDSDGDGLTDGEEVNEYGTDPANADTDGGGVGDGEELDNGTDPLNGEDDYPADSGLGDTGIDKDDPLCGCAVSPTEAPQGALLSLLGLLGLVGLRRRQS